MGKEICLNEVLVILDKKLTMTFKSPKIVSKISTRLSLELKILQKKNTFVLEEGLDLRKISQERIKDLNFKFL